MITYKYMPDEFQDCGILGEHPIEIHASIDTKGGCPETQPLVNIWNVIAVIDIYGPIRVDITKRIATNKALLQHWEEQVLKDYCARFEREEESA